jgi:hypothetical protein
MYKVIYKYEWTHVCTYLYTYVHISMYIYENIFILTIIVNSIEEIEKFGIIQVYMYTLLFLYMGLFQLQMGSHRGISKSNKLINVYLSKHINYIYLHIYTSYTSTPKKNESRPSEKYRLFCISYFLYNYRIISIADVELLKFQLNKQILKIKSLC